MGTEGDEAAKDFFPASVVVEALNGASIRGLEVGAVLWLSPVWNSLRFARRSITVEAVIAMVWYHYITSLV